MVLPQPTKDEMPTLDKRALDHNGVDVIMGGCCTAEKNAEPDTILSHRHLRFSCRDHLHYLSDRIMTKPLRFFIALAVCGLLQVIVGACAYFLVWRLEPGDPRDRDSINAFSESMWEAWTFMADPGSHAKVLFADQRIIGSLITLGGIIFFASILGLTVDIVREKMDSLRQGKSKIVEKNHTLILGWTEKTVHIIEELCKANESEGGGVVAVLAPVTKEQMEVELQLQLPVKCRRGTRIVFRTGSPLVAGDLIKVSVHMARAIIILSYTGNADQADSEVLRTLLSLRSLYNHLQGHVVAEVRDIDNEPLVKLVGGTAVETMVSHDVIGRLMLMSVRQPGLAKVYEALLGFDGDEFYMSNWPELEGSHFGDVITCFNDAIPIGIQSRNGHIRINPSDDALVEPGDKIVVIAEDNDTYRPQTQVLLDAGSPPPVDSELKSKEKILFCGWRRDIRDILQQLDKIVERDSEVHMMTHCVKIAERNDKLLEDGLDIRELQNLVLVHHYGNTSVRRKLEALPLEQFSSCMIFADQAFEADTLHADSHSLATLLLIRDIQSTRSSRSPSRASSEEDDSHPAFGELMRSLTDLNRRPRCPIVCEILDPHTQKTIAANHQLSLTSDFCQTNKLIAQILAMIAEERTVNLLFGELLGSTGCNIAVVPSSRYAPEGELLSFLALAKRARLFDEIIIGYQMRGSIEKTVLNPPRKDQDYRWDFYDFAILRGKTVTRSSETTKCTQAFASMEQRTALREELLDRQEQTRTQLSELPNREHPGPPFQDVRRRAAAKDQQAASCHSQPTAELNRLKRWMSARSSQVGADRQKIVDALNVLTNAIANASSESEELCRENIPEVPLSARANAMSFAVHPTNSPALFTTEQPLVAPPRAHGDVVN